METVTQVLATTNEISLKGGNRKWFERTLTDNVRRAVKDLPGASVTRPAWRVLVDFAEPVPFTEVARRLHTVFGLGAIMAIEQVGSTLDDLERALEPELRRRSPASFAVRCLRSDKSFPMTSPEIERAVGTFVQKKVGWPVDLRHPELTLHVLVDQNGLSTWIRRVAGPGGLPVGVGGRGTCLLSGGIDSPVAAYMMMKRGMRLDFVHFHSVPRTDPASLEKVHDLVRVLNRFQGPSRVAMIPLLAIQEEVAARCPAALRVLLYRRFMIQLAERLAGRFRGRALVTGESLGQVASQTIENMSAVEAAASSPVLRPLIGLDKQQIIAIARRAGTFELSIQPHFDCCSFLMPYNPATKSTAAELERAATELDERTLLADALARADIHRIADAAPWDEMPIPDATAP
ncbi:MAG: tRNA uracil 4-sulfurtransferase ThiI [Holophagae bacterium]|jgi:thiamine biosynthesis protein ThiI